MSNPHLSPPLGVGVGGDLTFRHCPRLGKVDFPPCQIPTSPPPTPHWGGWGITLIAALVQGIFFPSLGPSRAKLLHHDESKAFTHQRVVSRAAMSRSSFLDGYSRLRKLCHDGNYRKVTEFVNAITDAKALEDHLTKGACKGTFGYALLHEIVARGHHEILDFLLGKAGDGHVNCQANSGYTPLHLAAGSGHAECVRVLLKHNADISVTDEYGKTPKQTAELGLKTSIVRILRSAGEFLS